MKGRKHNHKHTGKPSVASRPALDGMPDDGGGLKRGRRAEHQVEGRGAKPKLNRPRNNFAKGGAVKRKADGGDVEPGIPIDLSPAGQAQVGLALTAAKQAPKDVVQQRRDEVSQKWRDDTDAETQKYDDWYQRDLPWRGSKSGALGRWMVDEGHKHRYEDVDRDYAVESRHLDQSENRTNMRKKSSGMKSGGKAK